MSTSWGIEPHTGQEAGRKIRAHTLPVCHALPKEVYRVIAVPIHPLDLLPICLSVHPPNHSPTHRPCACPSVDPLTHLASRSSSNISTYPSAGLSVHPSSRLPASHPIRLPTAGCQLTSIPIDWPPICQTDPPDMRPRIHQSIRSPIRPAVRTPIRLHTSRSFNHPSPPPIPGEVTPIKIAEAMLSPKKGDLGPPGDLL